MFLEHTATPLSQRSTLQRWIEPLAWFHRPDMVSHQAVVRFAAPLGQRAKPSCCLTILSRRDTRAACAGMWRTAAVFIDLHTTGLVDGKDHVWLGGYPSSIRDDSGGCAR